MSESVCTVAPAGRGPAFDQLFGQRPSGRSTQCPFSLRGQKHQGHKNTSACIPLLWSESCLLSAPACPHPVTVLGNEVGGCSSLEAPGVPPIITLLFRDAKCLYLEYSKCIQSLRMGEWDYNRTISNSIWRKSEIPHGTKTHREEFLQLPIKSCAK